MITFFGMPERSSGKTRGVQLAPVLNGNFFDKNQPSTFINNSKVHNNCVFIRAININIAKHFKGMGKKIAYDLLDRPVADLHRAQNADENIRDLDWSKYVHDVIDIFIVNNNNAKQRLAEFINQNQKIVIIPHHVIVDNIDVKFSSRRPKRIGYLGIPNQIHRVEEIKTFCEKNNLELCVENHDTKSGCLSFLKTLDIGLVYVEKNLRTDYVLKFKPNVKLNNFQSMGIPTIACDYSSFLENSKEGTYFRANSLEEVFQSILEIINNDEKRNSIVREGYKNASKFTIDKICSLYKQAFNNS
jgi:hypothetical protein